MVLDLTSEYKVARCKPCGNNAFQLNLFIYSWSNLIRLGSSLRVGFRCILCLNGWVFSSLFQNIPIYVRACYVKKIVRFYFVCRKNIEVKQVSTSQVKHPQRILWWERSYFHSSEFSRLEPNKTQQMKRLHHCTGENNIE